MSWGSRVVVFFGVFLAAGCMETRYVIQAGIGQAELWSLARPVEDVIDDPETDARTRALLLESRRILQFAKENGMPSKGNYKQYVELDRGQVVWFMAASQKLSFTPEVWTFPLVGSFPYLGWFDQDEARSIRRRLEKRGLDVYVRPVHAYSTGGWLDDPILSTMLSPDDDAFRYLSNVLLHELTHANLFVENQATFNESLASFVGDTMADQYLSQRFGPRSLEVVAYREEEKLGEERAKRFVDTYRLLETLYESEASKDAKRQRKHGITRALQLELGLAGQPNNASLLGFKVYNTGKVGLAKAYEACGHNWSRFFRAVRKLKSSDFGAEQAEELDVVSSHLEERCQDTRGDA